MEQTKEVLQRFDLAGMVHPFSRCTVCNGEIVSVEKNEVLDKLPPRVAETYKNFSRCRGCDRIYWQGSHFIKINAKIKMLLTSAKEK